MGVYKISPVELLEFDVISWKKGSGLQVTITISMMSSYRTFVLYM